MNRTVLIFGLILGVIITGNMLVMMNLLTNNPAMQTNDVLGYAAIVIVFSLIFFGVRNYRNKELGGQITFLKAFKTGAMIAFIASTMYVIIGMISYYVFFPDWIDTYTQHVMIRAERSGATEAELAQKAEEMAQFKDMYRNPLFVVLSSYFEMLPIGLVVALVSSLILKKKVTADPVVQ